MKAVLMGVGALGTIVGGLIAKNGGDITLVDARQETVDKLNRDGVTIVGKMNETNIPVKAVTPDKMQGPYGIAIILTKQTFNETALKQLLPHLNSASVVCTLQNGLPEESVGSYVGRERTVGGTVGWGATWQSPGVSELISDLDRMSYEVGELDGTITDRLKSVAELLSLAGQCNCVSNLTGIRWSKLLMNSALSGMSAALGSTFGQVLEDDRGAMAAAHLANELIAIADKLGISLEVLHEGYNFYDLRFTDKAGRDRAVAWLRKFYVPDWNLKASMLQDMEKGIPTEIMHINGVVAMQGRKAGIPTPTNDTVIKIVSEFDSGKRPFPTRDCLDLFSLPELS